MTQYTRPERLTLPAGSGVMAAALERVSAARPRNPIERDMRPQGNGRGPSFDPPWLAPFQRLSKLVPPGSWPKTLPTTLPTGGLLKPVQIGIGERARALLPESEHGAFNEAISLFVCSRLYLEALAVDEAVRFADDGWTTIGLVADEHRAAAAAMLLGRAVKAMKQQRP